MTLKNIWTETGKWLRSHKLYRPLHSHPQLDEDGLISEDVEAIEQSENEQNSGEAQSSEVLVKAVQPAERNESLEKLQNGLTELVDQLKGINEHLDRQANHHEELMNRMQQLPKMLESFPAATENQKKITEELLEQLKGFSIRNEQFVDAVEQIPNQTAKQTDALVNIDHQLAAAADTDVQMTQSFNNFYQTLEKLNETTTNQTESLNQMSKTFAASDRYLKYIISKHNRRYMWLFVISISICAVAILILTGIIIYLRS